MVPDPRPRARARGGRADRHAGPADGTLIVETDDPARITELLAGHGIWLTELTPVRADLETFFLDLTAGDTLGTASDR